MFDDGTFAGSQGPLSGTASNAIRWTNNGVQKTITVTVSIGGGGGFDP